MYIGRGRIAGVIHVKAVDSVALNRFDQAVARPLVDPLVARTQANAPLLIAPIQWPPLQIAQGKFGIDLAAVAPQADVPPHLNPRALACLDDALQGRIVKAADNPRHWLGRYPPRRAAKRRDADASPQKARAGPTPRRR